MDKFKRGFVPVIVLFIVLAVSSGIIFYLIRDQKKVKAVATIYPTPVGVLHISPTTFSNKASSYFSASEVYGANGAAVDNVRYYIINPKLGQSNAWGNPDWCASGGTCNQSTQGLVTYNIGSPANSGDFGVTWGLNTKNAESTQYDRGLSPYLLPGLYQIGMRVQDVNGNVNGNTGSVWVTITDGTLPSPTPAPNLGLKFSTTYFGLKMASGGVGKKAFDLTSTGATKFWLYTPTNSLGIGFSPSEGNIAPGQTIPIYVKAGAGQPFGIYTGTVYAASSLVNGQTSTGVTDSITIEPGSNDSDVDKFTNDIENKIGTDPNYGCQTPAGLSAWPPDIDNDKAVTILDLSKMSKAIGGRAGDTKYNKRYDLNVDNVISISDITIASQYNGKSCQ